MRSICVYRLSLLCLVLGLLTSCGGGGGGGAPSNPNPGLPPPAGTLTGTLTFISGANAVVVEQEPNDDFGAAQQVGDRYPGQSVTLIGALDATGAADVFDAFRVRLPVRSRVTATVRYGVLGDLDLAIYDPIGMQFVETFDVPTSPASHVLDLKGTMDFVVTTAAGKGSYEIELQIEVASGAVEREPNDTAATGNYLGEIAVGDSFVVTGNADAATDAVDTVLVACPEAMALGLTLQFPSFRNFDLRVLDGTSDLSSPSLLQAFASPLGPPETGTVVVPGGTLLVIEVEAAAGSGLWNLALTAGAPPAPLVTAPTTQLLAVRPMASTALEARRLRHVHAQAHPYGRVDENVAIGEALVAFRKGRRAMGEVELARGGGRVGAELPDIACKVDLDLPAGLRDDDARRMTLSRTCAAACGDCVRYSEPNRIRRMTAAPNDTYYDIQWHYELINLEAAWELTTGSAGTIVAVIDTGRILHPDLNARYIGGYDTVSHPQLTGDGNGPDGDPTDLGVQTGFHGTHVAGTIGAETNNGTGVAGVTWQTRLMPLRALGNYGAGTDFDIAAAILWAARRPNSTGTLPAERADVINMSLGGPNFNQTLADAVAEARDAGVTVIASAGNANSNELQYPASYAGVISVSAVDAQRQRSPYSSFGTEVDIAAPGGHMGVDVTGDGYPDGVLSTVDGGYEFYEGTSMAAPHVAGVAALVLGVNDQLTPDQVESVLESTADDLGTPGFDTQYGNGLVDAFAAVAAVTTPSGSTPPRLIVTPASLNFGTTGSELLVQLYNVGSGLVTITDVEVVLNDGESWLQAELVGTGDASINADALRVFVDRVGVGNGAYFGRVIVRSDAGDQEIAVAMQERLSVAPPPDLAITVFAVSIETGQIVGEVIVNPAVSLEYIFGGLVAGEYLIVAGTDVDNDGVYDEPGEYGGAWPVQSDPLPVLVVPNITTSQVDFDVGLGQVIGTASGGR